MVSLCVWGADIMNVQIISLRLIRRNKLIDFAAGAKTTGSKFYFLTGEDALREWQLINTMINFHTERGYTFVIPPYLVNEATAKASGMIPDFDGDFYATTDNLFLIPTAEKPMVGFHSNEIFQEDELPKKYVAFSPCFRKEAGSYGKRDKGLRRVHIFHKIELFELCTPDNSYAELDKMVEQVCALTEALGLEYRVVELEEKDRSPVACKTFDIEVKHQDEWLEVSSISNTEDRQSKPALIRYRPQNGGKPVKVHLLNGSGLALPRVMLALFGE
ncbi:MAG: Serine-tRNA ligase, partial [Candidatus Woesebacteria bacterium GW2011_GWB1_39_12]